MATDDPFDLQRFLSAQDADGSFQRAVDELGQGRKVSHWMWYVLPQLAGLGRSAMAQRFAIGSTEEAVAYLRHPVLGPRLVQCAELLAAGPGGTAVEVLGAVDAQKLRSSMTLFMLVDPQCAVFGAVLDRYFDGQPDPLTVRSLQAG